MQMSIREPVQAVTTAQPQQAKVSATLRPSASVIIVTAAISGHHSCSTINRRRIPATIEVICSVLSVIRRMQKHCRGDFRHTSLIALAAMRQTMRPGHIEVRVFHNYVIARVRVISRRRNTALTDASGSAYARPRAAAI